MAAHVERRLLAVKDDYFSLAKSLAVVRAEELSDPERTCYCNEAGFDNCRCVEPCKGCGNFDCECNS